MRLRELEGENGSLRQELERLDAQNNNLQVGTGSLQANVCEQGGGSMTGYPGNALLCASPFAHPCPSTAYNSNYMSNGLGLSFQPWQASLSPHPCSPSATCRATTWTTCPTRTWESSLAA